MAKRKQRKINKAQETAYWENRRREREEDFVNSYWEENKYKLVPAIIFVILISSPFIAVKKTYDYLKKHNCCSVHPENIF